MMAVSAQSSVDVENTFTSSFASSKTAQTATTQRKRFRGNETCATKVFVRVRPFSAAERKQSGSGDPPAIVTVHDENPSHITTLDPSKQYMPKSTYIFDRCFNSAVLKPAAGDDAQLLLPDGKDGATTAISTLEDVAAEDQLNPLQLDCLERDQAAVYGYVGRPVLMNALSGYNGCVFAYGQTGSGKTYTMIGPPGIFGEVVRNPATAGIVTAVNNSVTAQPSGGTSVASPAGKTFRRAATGYAALQRSTQDSSMTNSSINGAGDSRFQSYASMTPYLSTAAARTPGLAETTSFVDNDSSPCDDKTLNCDAGGGRGALGVEGNEGLQGIVPRLVRDLFDELHLKREHDSSHSFRVEVEYYEIYREKVMDLLSSHNSNTNTELRVRQSKVTGPYVENLKKKHVEDERQVFHLLRQGTVRRHTASTSMNDHSSRSHAIFVLHLVQMHLNEDDSSSAKLTSKVNLVDLAGSEKTGAHNVEGDQFKEGVVINISLTVLGRVVDALADMSQGKRNVFCPYRDSVLTWLLMDSLGGNSKTTMLATVSPHCTNFEEACQTLRYASRAKQIVTEVMVNEDPQARQIKTLTAEVQRLKALLVAEGKATDNDEDIEALQDRICALEGELNEARAELEEKSAELSNLLAIRRTTSSLPSTLKAGNSGAAGTAKELSKAKSDVRRLEAENLLHMQTEEELRRSLERVKTLEHKCTRLLTDLKESQDSSKKLEKEKQERDRRIVELQQQLFKERAKAYASLPGASSPLVSPSGASVHSAATTSTTKVLTPTVVNTATGGLKKSSLAMKCAAHKMTTSGKKGGRRSRGNSTTTTVATADTAEGDWETERAELCAQFEEEKKVLNLQVHERADAFRKSQLDVKELKSELKTAQDMLLSAEKRLNDSHADTVRRLQEEVQVLRRTLKDERKSNGDLRQLMTGPVQKRPFFSFAYVVNTLSALERTQRNSVVAEENAWRSMIVQTILLRREEAERTKRVAATHEAQLADLQWKADEQLKELVALHASHDKLQAAHATLTKAEEQNVAAVACLRAELADTATSKDEAATAHRDDVARLEEQIEALRKTATEQQESVTVHEKRQQDLEKEVLYLQAQLQQEKERLSAAIAQHEHHLSNKESALAAAVAAKVTLEATYTKQLEKLNVDHASTVSALEVENEQLQERLKKVQEELHCEKEAHEAESQRSNAQAKEQAQALAVLQAQLDSAAQSSDRAAETHEVERHFLKKQLARQEAESTAKVAALQQQADTLQQALDACTVESSSSIRNLTEQLAAAHADLSKSEEARQALMERSSTLAAAHEQHVRELEKKLTTQQTETAKATAALQQELAEVQATLQQAQTSSIKTTALLEAELNSEREALQKSEKARKAHIQRTVELAAAQEQKVSELANKLAAATEATAALRKTHTKEVAALQQECQAKESDLAAQVNTLNEKLRTQEALAQTQLREKESDLAAMGNELKKAQEDLAKSEQARRTVVQNSLVQAEEHSKSVAALQLQLQQERHDAVAAANTLTEQLHDVERRLEHKTATADATAAALHQELNIQRHRIAEQAVQHARYTKELEEQLEAVQKDKQTVVKARETEQKRFADESAEHAAAVVALQAQLAEAKRVMSASDAAHAATVQCMELEMSKVAEDTTMTVAGLQDKLREAQTQMARSEQALQKQTEECVKQAKAHAKSLKTLEKRLESDHKHQVDKLKKSHADSLAALEAQLASQTTLAQSLRDDLNDTRSQVKQMVETQNYLRSQLENEQLTTKELRLHAEVTEKARTASAAEAAQLQKKLKATMASVEELTQEVAKLSDELKHAHEVSTATQQQLEVQVRENCEKEQRIGQQAVELKAVQALVESLRSDVQELQTHKAELLKAQEALTERQQEQLVTQQVDIVTELEAQFRLMEKERHEIEEKARQTEDSLRATIEKQSKEIRQMREDLDFNVSMNHFELDGKHRGTAAGSGAVSQGAGLSSNVSSSIAPSLVGGGAGGSKSASNGSNVSRAASPVGGTAKPGVVAGMLSSFFRRSTTGAVPAPMTASTSASHTTTRLVQWRSSVLNSRSGGGGESRTSVSTPVRRGSNFYIASPSRPPSTASLFCKCEANGSAAGAGLFTRVESNASIDAHAGDAKPASWQNPSANCVLNTIVPPE